MSHGRPDPQVCIPNWGRKCIESKNIVLMKTGHTQYFSRSLISKRFTIFWPYDRPFVKEFRGTVVIFERSQSNLNEKDRFACTGASLVSRRRQDKRSCRTQTTKLKMSNIHIECILHAPAGTHTVQNMQCDAHVSPSTNALLPSPPSKFSRSQTVLRSECKNKSEQHFEQDFIQSIRRKTCEQMCASDLCPVGASHAAEDLWAAVEHIFLQ